MTVDGDVNSAIWINFSELLLLSLQLASLVSCSLKKNNNEPYASSWLERLRSIKRLRKKILDSHRADFMSSSTGNLSSGGMGGSTTTAAATVAVGIGGEHHHHHQAAGALTRINQMDDFTTYTQ